MIELAELNEVLKNDETAMTLRIKEILLGSHFAPLYSQLEKERDIVEIKKLIRDSESKRHTALETMKLEITKELQRINARKI